MRSSYGKWITLSWKKQKSATKEKKMWCEAESYQERKLDQINENRDER